MSTAGESIASRDSVWVLDAARGERGGRDLGYAVDVQTSVLGDRTFDPLIKSQMYVNEGLKFQ